MPYDARELKRTRLRIRPISEIEGAVTCQATMLGSKAVNSAAIARGRDQRELMYRRVRFGDGRKRSSCAILDSRSKQFANLLVTEIGRVTKLLGNTHRSAGFAVLKSATVASVLIEIGYLSNRAEERLLRSGRHRARLTGAIMEAIEVYFARQEIGNRS